MQAPPIRLSNSTQKLADPNLNLNLNLDSDDAPTSNVSTGRTTPTGTPYRKPPHCSICKQPRKGHPRSGCPLVNLSSSMINSDSPSVLTKSLGTVAEEYDHVVKTVLSECHNLQPTTGKRNNAPLILSANSKENAQHNISRLESGAAVVTIPQLAMETTMKDEMLVQHSLSAPIPLSHEQTLPTISESMCDVHSANRPMELEKSDNNTDPTSPRGCMSESFPPTPSIEREIFLLKLSEQALAAIYVIPKADSEAIFSQAVALKLNAELVMSQNDDEPNALIIFDHKEKTLRALLRVAMASEDIRAQVGMWKRSITFRTSAAAVVVGAIGAWAALALA